MGNRWLKIIEQKCLDSITNGYSISNTKIIESTGLYDFFGVGLSIQLTSILNEQPYNTAKTAQELTSFNSRRNESIKSIESMSNIFNDLNVFAHYHPTEIYELGILFPISNEFSKIKVITKELNRWDKLLKDLKELTGEDSDDTEISLVSEGSIQFFIENSPTIALVIISLMDKILGVFKKVQEVRIHRKKLEDLGFKEELKALKKSEKEIVEKEVDNSIEEIVVQFKSKKIVADEGRLNELKISLKGHANFIVKSIGSGVVVEITPPELVPPDLSKISSEAEKKKKQALYDAQMARLELIKGGIGTFKELAGVSEQTIKLLSNTNSNEENELENDNLEV